MAEPTRTTNTTTTFAIGWVLPVALLATIGLIVADIIGWIHVAWWVPFLPVIAAFATVFAAFLILAVVAIVVFVVIVFKDHSEKRHTIARQRRMRN